MLPLPGWTFVWKHFPSTHRSSRTVVESAAVSFLQTRERSIYPLSSAKTSRSLFVTVLDVTIRAGFQSIGRVGKRFLVNSAVLSGLAMCFIKPDVRQKRLPKCVDLARLHCLQSHAPSLGSKHRKVSEEGCDFFPYHIANVDTNGVPRLYPQLGKYSWPYRGV